MEEQPLSRAEAQALLQYAEATYRSVTTYRRRVAAAAVALMIVFGLVCVFAAAQWLSTRSRVDDVPDRALVEALGVEIPDPRPAVERGQLRLQSLLWGVVTGAAATMTLLSLAVYLMSRPPGGLRGIRSG